MSWKYAALAALISCGLSGSVHAGVLQKPTDNTGSGGSDLTGYFVKYIFSGVIDVDGEAAVTIHCTNVGSVDTTMAVEIFDEPGDFVGDASTSILIEESKTISTNGTFYGEVPMDIIGSNRIGSGRVLTPDKKASLLCGAYVTEPSAGGAPPAFMSTIPMVPIGKAPKPKISKN